MEAGNDLDKTSYIKEMTDDADSQESLFNQIEIDGDVDTAVPGDYTLTYHVTDSDGNRSNAAVLPYTFSKNRRTALMGMPDRAVLFQVFTARVKFDSPK